MNKQKIIIAVAWPYANGDLHLGHPAGYLLPADVMNKYQRLRGRDVIMVSGSDMHGTPVAVKAWKDGVAPHDYALMQHKRHMAVMQQLGLDYSLYTHTATEIHAQVVQQVFTTLEKAGYISKQKTEQFWSEKEHKFLLDRYIEGTCPFCGFEKARGDQCDNCGHALTPDELVNPYSIFGDEELVKRASTNYFLDLAKLQPLLEKHYADNADFKIWRKHVQATTQAWLAEGLLPRAITRDMEGYGVALPVGYEIEREEGKVIYVWFEAVTGYLSASVALSLLARHKGIAGSTSLETSPLAIDEAALRPAVEALARGEDNISDIYGGQSLDWQSYWLAGQAKSYYFMGKDNIPFHSVIWTAMLLGLSQALGVTFNTPDILAANQYLNLKGAKFSKSTGNIIDTKKFFEEYGSDASRFFLLSRMPENKDYDFTMQEFMEANNSELLANLGNFVNRSLVFWNKQFALSEADKKFSDLEIDSEVVSKVNQAFTDTAQLLEECKFAKALSVVTELGSFANKYFNDSQIWTVVKTDRTRAQVQMAGMLFLAANIAKLLGPFLPEFSENVSRYLGQKIERPEVGRDDWKSLQLAEIGLDSLGEIAELKPLIARLEIIEEGNEQTQAEGGSDDPDK